MSEDLQRRRFLQLLLLSGVAVGCRRLGADGQATPTLPWNTLAPTMTLVPALRFELEHQAIAYGPHPGGCDRTTIRGRVYDANGMALPGVAVRVWLQDESWAQSLTTDAQGSYEVDVAQGTSEAVFLLQLVDQANSALLSDVIVAQAIPSCDLNLMTVNFTAGG